MKKEINEMNNKKEMWSRIDHTFCKLMIMHMKRSEKD